MYDAVDCLIEALGQDDIAEIVTEAAVAGRITVTQAIHYTNIAAWCGTDNGASMMLTLDSWIRSADDPVRLAVALHHEAYPLPTRAEMAARLTEIAHRFPEHREVCARLIAGRTTD